MGKGAGVVASGDGRCRAMTGSRRGIGAALVDPAMELDCGDEEASATTVGRGDVGLAAAAGRSPQIQSGAEGRGGSREWGGSGATGGLGFRSGTGEIGQGYWGGPADC